MKHQAKKQTRNQHMPVVIVCILILVLAVMGLGMHFIKKYIPTKERMNLTEYYGQPGDGEMAVVLGTEIMEERALMSGDQIYLPLDMVNTYLNQRYYWDSADQQVLYATPSELQYYPAAEMRRRRCMAEGWNSLSASWFRAEIYRPGCLCI